MTHRSMPTGIFADPRDGIMIRFENDRYRKITNDERGLIVAALRGSPPMTDFDKGIEAAALSPSYIEMMRAHVDEGGRLSQGNGLHLLAEVERLSALRSPAPAEFPSVEEVARIIDPDAYQFHQDMIDAGISDGMTSDHALAQADRSTAYTIPKALAKATAILALLQRGSGR